MAKYSRVPAANKQRWVKIAAFLLLSAVPHLHAATNSPPAVRPRATVAAEDAFVQEERRTRTWFEFPGAMVRGWQLAVRVPTNAFRVGQPITLVVVFKNVWTNSLRLHISTPGVPYMFSPTVLDRAGHPIKMDDEAREHLEHSHADFAMFRDVPPAASLAFPFELQKLYLFSQPGLYQVQATARWLPGNAHGIPGSPENTAPVLTGLGQFRLVPPDKPPIPPQKSAPAPAHP